MESNTPSWDSLQALGDYQKWLYGRIKYLADAAEDYSYPARTKKAHAALHSFCAEHGVNMK